jgi:tRNA A37 threonylcarbamoyladenosine modification protein TsaB
VTSLDAITAAADVAGDRTIVAVLGAMRNEVFVQASGRVTRPPACIKTVDFSAWFASLGDGDAAVIGDAHPIVEGTPPRARYLAKVAASRAKGEADLLEPLYVRPPEITKPKEA